MVLCFLVCFMAPSFTDFIGFVGSFQFMLLGMVMPPVVYYYVKRDKMGRVGKGFQIGYILMNVGLWIVATVYSIAKLVKS